MAGVSHQLKELYDGQDTSGGGMTKVVIGDATRITRIYALCDPATDEVRYIGKTVQSLRHRLMQHRRAAKKGSLPVNRWLLKHEGVNFSGPYIKLIELVPPGGDWASRECAWIEHFAGRLLNLTKGGEGLAGHTFTEQHRAKISAALKTGSIKSCLACGSEFWRKANQIAKGQDKFCSKSCSNKFNKGGWECRSKK